MTTPAPRNIAKLVRNYNCDSYIPFPQRIAEMYASDALRIRTQFPAEKLRYAPMIGRRPSRGTWHILGRADAPLEFDTDEPMAREHGLAAIYYDKKRKARTAFLGNDDLEAVTATAAILTETVIEPRRFSLPPRGFYDNEHAERRTSSQLFFGGLISAEALYGASALYRLQSGALPEAQWLRERFNHISSESELFLTLGAYAGGMAALWFAGSQFHRRLFKGKGIKADLKRLEHLPPVAHSFKYGPEVEAYLREEERREQRNARLYAMDAKLRSSGVQMSRSDAVKLYDTLQRVNGHSVEALREISAMLGKPLDEVANAVVTASSALEQR